MGKVTSDDFPGQDQPGKEHAPAEFLDRVHKVFYSYDPDRGFELTTEVRERLIIHTRAGFGFATKVIPLHLSDRNEETISSVKGTTYNLVDGKLQTSKLTRDGLFEEAVSEFGNRAKIVMPDVREGSIIEYEYLIKSPFIYKIDEIPVQDHIPVRNLYIKARIPEYFVYRPLIKGSYPIQLQQSVQPYSTNFNYRQKQPVAGMGEVNQTGFERRGISYNEHLTEVVLKDIPALVPEAYVDNIENYQAALNFEISSLIVPGLVHENFATSWDDVARVILNQPGFYNEVRKTQYFSDDLDTFLAGEQDASLKVFKVVNFLKSRIRWNGNNGVLTNEGCHKAYKTGQGNVSELNLMLVAMLNYSGIEAHPVLLSTRDNGIPLFPSLNGFNYVITAVRIKEQEFLIDATEPFAGIGMIPMRAMNWSGRLVTLDGTTRVLSLNPKLPSREGYRMQVSLRGDGSIEGQVRGQYTEQIALKVRNSYHSGTAEAYVRDLEEQNGGMAVSNHQLKNGQEVLKPLIETYNFHMENMVTNMEDRIYFSPMFFFALSENPFKAEERAYPVDFGYPLEQAFLIHVLLPEGYGIEHLPEPLTMALPGGMGVFEYRIGAAENSMNIQIKLQRDTPIVAPQQYALLKEFYRQIVEKETEKVVLLKRTSDEHTERAAGGR